MSKIKTKEHKEIRYKISYIQNLISVLEDLIKYHEPSLEKDFSNFLKNISTNLSKYHNEMHNLISDDEKEVLIAETMDFGSYYSSKNTTSEAHKSELLQEAYTQAFGIQEHFDKFHEFPEHLAGTAQNIYNYIQTSEVCDRILQQTY